jgi:hypothetical protein
VWRRAFAHQQKFHTKQQAHHDARLPDALAPSHALTPIGHQQTHQNGGNARTQTDLKCGVDVVCRSFQNHLLQTPDQTHQHHEPYGPGVERFARIHSDILHRVSGLSAGNCPNPSRVMASPRKSRKRRTAGNQAAPRREHGVEDARPRVPSRAAPVPAGPSQQLVGGTCSPACAHMPLPRPARPS